MTMDASAVGARVGPVVRSWDPENAILYALGVGAGAEPEKELEFTTCNSIGVRQQVLPTFAAAIAAEVPPLATALAGAVDQAKVVHGTQRIELLDSLPVAGTVRMTGEISGIWDKGSGALITVDVAADEEGSGRRLFVATFGIFVRDAGGWGGARGPTETVPAPPERDPDHIVVYATLPQQALIYRLSGDWYPLHSDPEFAREAGFDRPILHGLCTYGFAGRALLKTVCDMKPERFSAMEGRFARPAWPEDVLTVRIWSVSRGEALFEVATQRGECVLSGGRFTHR